MRPEDFGLPEAGLADLPTPLEEAPRFARALGGRVRIFVKRDDATGLALGGNKARKLDLLVGEAIALGSDTLVTCGGPQSNHARMTAAAARKHGMEPVLVLDGRDPGIRQGNLLLDHLLGAELVFSGDRPAGEMMLEVAERLKEAGRNPYVIPLGGSNPLGALGYVPCVEEILEQTGRLGITPDALYVATGSSGTLAGLILGKIMFDVPFRVVGVAVSPNATLKEDRAVDLVMGAADLLKARAGAIGDSGSRSRYAKALERLFAITPEAVSLHVSVTGGEVGEGYGIPTEGCLESIRLLARTEGILVDPVYTGKALAGLMRDVRGGAYGPGWSIVFLHTGGVPADFAYTDVLTERGKG